MTVKTYSIVYHGKDDIVQVFNRLKIKGRDKNPTPCKIQYPMKNQSKILSGIPLVLYDYTSMLYNSHMEEGNFEQMNKEYRIMKFSKQTLF